MARRFIGLVAALGLSVAGLVAAPAHVWAQTKILLLDSNVINYLPVYVAIDQGYFAKQGLAVERQTIPNASYTTAALFSGSAQIGTLSPFPLIQAVDAGLDLVVLATSDVLPSAVRTGVVVPESSSIKTPKDLIGKKVAVAGINGALHVMTRKWLLENGVDYNKVSFVEISYAQMGDALRTGQVDAATSVDPFFGRIVDSNAGRSMVDLMNSSPKGTASNFYAASRTWITQHPDVVPAFRAAMTEAVAFIDREPARARDILATYTKLSPQVTSTAPMPDFKLTASQAQVDFYAGIARAQDLIGAKAQVSGLVLP